MEKAIGAVPSVIKELLTPAIKRGGLFLAGILTTYGVAAEHADIVLTAFGALASVGFDIMVVMIKRKSRAQ